MKALRFLAARPILLGSLLSLLGSPPQAAHAADQNPHWTVEGRVVDQQGEPVLDFDAAHYWSANGRQWDEEGKAPELQTEEEIAEFWDDEGKMLPWPGSLV